MGITLPTMRLTGPTSLKYDKRQEGWELVEEGPSLQAGQELKFIEFLEQGESFVVGNEMFARATKLGTRAGQHQAEQMLDQKIPEELRPFVLVFPGTQWRSPDGLLFVPYLCWGGGHWYLHFFWLGSLFLRRYLVALFCK